MDIVLPNAGELANPHLPFTPTNTTGVSEIGRFDPAEDGPRAAGDKPTPPNLTTLDIDLTAVLYTTRLALWHFERDDRVDPGLRAIAFTGSMSSFFGSDGVMYGAAKA